MPDFPAYDSINTPVKSPVAYQGYGAGAAQICFFSQFFSFYSSTAIALPMMVMVRAMEKVTEANARNCSSSHWRTALLMTLKGRDRNRRLSKVFFVEELAAMGSGFGEDCKSISEDTNAIDHHKASSNATTESQ